MSASELLPVTVVIPAYNAAKTIERALASVFAQLASPAEIIVVDDGSLDDTAELARAAGARVICQPNAGTGAARNTGIRAATGTWIALLDADDEWMPDKLAVQWEAAKLRPGVGLIASDYVYVHRDGFADGPSLPSLRGYQLSRRIPVAHDTAFISRTDAAVATVTGFFLLPSTLLIAAEVFAAGSFFRGRGELQSTPLCEEAEDFEWLMRALRASDVLVVERVLVTYHTQAGSLSSNPGRMRYGDVKLGERILSDPSKYAPGISEEIVRIRPSRLRSAVREFLRVGDIRSARTILADAMTERRSLADIFVYSALMLGDNWFGRFALESLRLLWKSALKPLVVRRSPDV
jgi:glycosyltransferase involved in cell wall biosynthesis